MSISEAGDERLEQWRAEEALFQQQKIVAEREWAELTKDGELPDMEQTRRFSPKKGTTVEHYRWVASNGVQATVVFTYHYNNPEPSYTITAWYKPDRDFVPQPEAIANQS
jgi:hypothetical protein